MAIINDHDKLRRIEDARRRSKEQEAILRQMELPAATDRQTPISVFGPNVQGDYGAPGILDSEFQDYGSPGLKGVDAYLGGLTAGNVALGADAPETPLEKLAASTLGMIGMGQAIAPTAALSGPLAAVSRAPQAMAGMLGLGAYGAAQPANTLDERAGNAADAMGIGLVLGAGSRIPGISKLTSTALGRFAYDAAAMGGLAKAEGESWGDAALAGIGAAAGLAASHPALGTDPRVAERLTRTPAEMEAPTIRTESSPAAASKADYAKEIADIRAGRSGISGIVPDNMVIRYTADGPALVPRSSVEPVAKPEPYDPAPTFRGQKIEDIPADRPKNTVARLPYDRPEAVLGTKDWIPKSPRPPMYSDPKYAGVSRPDIFSRERGGKDITADMLGLQQMYDKVAGAIRERAASRLAAGKASPAERRNQSSGTMPIEDVLASYNEGKITAQEMTTWMRMHPDKLAGSTTKESLESARAELVSEGVASPTEAEITSRARSNSLAQPIRDQLNEPGFIRDVSPSAAQFMDPLTVGQSIFGGQVSSLPLEASVRLGHRVEEAQRKMSKEMVEAVGPILMSNGISEGTADARSVGRVLDAEFSGDPLAESSNPRAVLNAARQLKPLLDQWWEMRNDVNMAFTGEPIGRKGGYWLHKERRIGMRESPVGWAAQVFKARESGSPLPGAPQQVFSARELNRTGRIEQEMREYDVWKGLRSYIADEAGRVSKTAVIASSEALVGEMRRVAELRRKEAAEFEKFGDVKSADAARKAARGIENSSESLRRVMQSSYNGIPFGINKYVTDFLTTAFPGTKDVAPLMPAYRGSKWLKGRFNEAKYILSAPFVLFRMPTSVGLVGSYPGVWENAPKWISEAAVEMWLPEAQNLVDSTHFGYTKQQALGGLGKEGLSWQSSQNTILREPGRMDAARILANKPTNYMENLTSRYAAVMANKIADHIGLSGKVKNDFINDAIMKTQSAYHSEAMAEIRKNPFVNVLAPAQSFSMTALSNAAEAALPGYGVDLYPGRPIRGLAGAAGAAVGMYLTNLIYQYLNTYQDLSEGEGAAKYFGENLVNTGAGFLPYSSSITGGGPGGGDLYPKALMEDMFGSKEKKGLFQYVGRGEYQRAAEIFSKHFLPGGGQISKAISADRMIKKGVLEEEDRALATSMGWWVTKRGKEYLRKMTGTDYSGDEEFKNTQYPGIPSGRPAQYGPPASGGQSNSPARPYGSTPRGRN